MGIITTHWNKIPSNQLVFHEMWEVFEQNCSCGLKISPGCVAFFKKIAISTIDQNPVSE